MENSIVIYGASGHGKVILDMLNQSDFQIEAIIDDAPKSSNLLDKPVRLAASFDFTAEQQIILAIGNNKVRKRLSSTLQAKFVTIIHPKAIVSKSSAIQEGTAIMAGAIVNPDVYVGKHCIINTGAVVEHDCVIGDFAHVCPNVSLAGGVEIGEGTQVGIGSTIIQGVKIGKWAIIGAGSVIIKDVPDYAVVVGNPGRIIKYVSNE